MQQRISQVTNVFDIILAATFLYFQINQIQVIYDMGQAYPLKSFVK